VTEQIERELTALFHDRASLLDVLPPRPVAQVRRARLQAGLALASVLAVLAGVGMAGARLANAGDSDRAVMVTATGERAQADLSKALRRTLAGRKLATSTTVMVPSGKFLDAPDLGFSSADEHRKTVETRYDGSLGTAVMSGTDGQAPSLFVRDELYQKPDQSYVGNVVPYGVAWIRSSKGPSQDLAEWRRQSIASAIPGLMWLYQFPPVEVSERAGRIRLTTPIGTDRVVIVVQLDRHGAISTVISRFELGALNAVSDREDRVVFAPLHGDIPDAEVPLASTVMSSDDFERAKKGAATNCPTPAPSTAPDGRSTTTSCTELFEAPK
jgi:hypothetical protein